jgi:predicted alpha/beta-hydrolase family hydrolase
MAAAFMKLFATRLGDRVFHFARFEFPYMSSKRVTGKPT